MLSLIELATQAETDISPIEDKPFPGQNTEVISPEQQGKGVTQAELEEVLARQGAGVPEKGEKSAQ